ncbi:MAG: hypothetical protein ACKO6K_05015, partial [Chitinophagaceae bacterium]
MKWIGVIIGICSFCNTRAQLAKVADPVPFAKTIRAEDLKKHLYILASGEMEGRETASEGQRKAAAYLETQFKTLGLLPGFNGNFQMPYPVFRDSIVRASLQVNQQSFELNKDFSLNPGNNYSATLYASEIVVAGQGVMDSLRNDYTQVDAKGKIVLVFPRPNPMPGTGGGSRPRIYYPYAL